MKHEFKPFDRVLVRDGDDCTWRIQFYSHPYGDYHACLNGVHTQCIPYEGNERLLGTTDSPEPEFKKGDAVLVWDNDDNVKKFKVYSHYDNDFCKHIAFDVLYRNGSTNGHMWDHVEKYVPASVED
jgi:hypothetical protein